MGVKFYRKERTEKLTGRLETKGGKVHLKAGGVLFEGKDFSTRTIPSCAPGSIDVKVKPKRAMLSLSWSVLGMPKKADIREADIPAVLSAKSDATPEYSVLKSMMIKHAQSSASSPFLSGTDALNKTIYDGTYLELDLKSRVPVKNKWDSGKEKEHLLYGQVASSDCDSITVLGQAAQKKIVGEPYLIHPPADDSASSSSPAASEVKSSPASSEKKEN